MGGCAAVDCTNSSKKGFRMFKFPTEINRRKKWIINCCRDNWVPGLRAELCSVSFRLLLKFFVLEIILTGIFIF